MEVCRAVDDQLVLGLRSPAVSACHHTTVMLAHYLAPAEVAVCCLFALDAVLSCPVE